MNILDTILATKHKEVQLITKDDIQQYEKSVWFERPSKNIQQHILGYAEPCFITEFKKQSPSKGVINANAKVIEVVRDYAAGGAVLISVLTDVQFFGGSLNDLIMARAATDKPLLRKDFIIDEKQIIEAKANGADVILLIAACLTKSTLKQLAQFAKSLQLEVLLEIHTEAELDYITECVDLVGVNNRNLKNFEVNLEHSMQLAARIGNHLVKVAESGITTPLDVRTLYEAGFQAFLIGELFMRSAVPGTKFVDFKKECLYAN
jgi:indole-3-glycerol phosphate synthase